MTELVAHARSAGVINPSLNMFKVPPTDISMSSRRYVRISPFNTGINPVTFQVDPQDEFINMTESYFEVEIVMKKNDGTNLLAADVIGLANNLAHTLFRQINVRLNGTLISPQTEEEAENKVETLNRKYNHLHADYIALKYNNLCDECQNVKDSTPFGKTYTVCKTCARGKETIESLQRELEKQQEKIRYWQDCYETALASMTDVVDSNHDG